MQFTCEIKSSFGSKYVLPNTNHVTRFRLYLLICQSNIILNLNHVLTKIKKSIQNKSFDYSQMLSFDCF